MKNRFIVLILVFTQHITFADEEIIPDSNINEDSQIEISTAAIEDDLLIQESVADDHTLKKTDPANYAKIEVTNDDQNQIVNITKSKKILAKEIKNSSVSNAGFE